MQFPEATPYTNNPFNHDTYLQPDVHGGHPKLPLHSPTQPKPQPQASPPPYIPANAAERKGCYTPISFHRSSSTAQFYGSLLDANGEPTEIFARMSDALFFYVDEHCDVPGLQDTGLIEPGKQAWTMIKNGQNSENAGAVQGYLKSYYDLANIRYCYTTTRFGENVVALDREGWLHMHVFEAISDPDEAFADWSKYITMFQLIDPLTELPFPTPFPRSALPTIGNQSLKQIVEEWKIQTAVAILKERQIAQEKSRVHKLIVPTLSTPQRASAFTSALARSTVTQPSYNAAALSRPTVTQPSYNAAAGAFGATVSPYVQQQPQYQYAPTPIVIENITQAAPATHSSEEHSTALDATTAAIKLTSAIVGALANGNNGS
ncbi:hypothetical protein EIP86_009440 [Pleurotus ostreatoroseus]|nr:hypothetical protein EIP86_009440 [Pleurotus ostreatoroseus]